MFFQNQLTDVEILKVLLMYKMDLNNKIISINFNNIDLVKEIKNEREIRREFCQEFSSDSSGDSQREERSLRISKWCSGIRNF